MKFVSDKNNFTVTGGLMTKKDKGPKAIGECHFCEKTKPFCEAHLLPDGLKRLMDDFRQPGAHFMLIDVVKNTARKAQTLFFDKNILCAQCDNKFGEYDAKLIDFIKLWRSSDARTKPILMHAEHRQIHVPSPVKEVKLAILATMYRFAISKRDRIVQLDDQQLAAVKSELESGEVSADRFPVFMLGAYRRFITFDDRRIDIAEITRPHPARWTGGYFLELFGLAIYVGFSPEAMKYASEFIGRPGNQDKVLVTVTEVEKVSAAFNEVASQMMLADGGHSRKK
jgi:hypothetical protein